VFLCHTFCVYLTGPFFVTAFSSSDCICHVVSQSCHIWYVSLIRRGYNVIFKSKDLFCRYRSSGRKKTQIAFRLKIFCHTFLYYTRNFCLSYHFWSTTICQKFSSNFSYLKNLLLRLTILCTLSIVCCYVLLWFHVLLDFSMSYNFIFWFEKGSTIVLLCSGLKKKCRVLQFSKS
jgi:hypothetical protein